MSALSRMIENLARPPEEIRAQNLREWASNIPGATPIGKVQERQRYKVAGVIQNIRIDPREGTGSIEATIIDGTGQILARWLGRQSLSGIRLGMGLVMEGICGRGTDNDFVVLNPEYELVPGPEHG